MSVPSFKRDLLKYSLTQVCSLLLGHGAANVTLGIPRLREIVMTASQNIKTPIMRLPLLEGITEKQRKMFCKDGSRLLLSQVVEEALVTERISGKTPENGFSRQKTYNLRLNFYPAEECLQEYNTTTARILDGLEATFIPILEREIVREIKRVSRDRQRQAASIGKGQRVNDSPTSRGEDEDGDVPGRQGQGKTPAVRQAADADSDDDDQGSDAGDGDADDAKRRQQSGAKATYDDDSDDEDGPSGALNEDDIEAAFRDDDASDAGSEEGDAELEARVTNLEGKLQESSKFVTHFSFDTKNGSWAEFDLQLSTESEKLLLIGVVERACRMAVVHEIPHISRILIAPAKGKDKVRFPLLHFG